jgi:hypothetical protein
MRLTGKKTARSASTRAAKATHAATSTETIAPGAASCFPRSPRRSICRRQLLRRKRPGHAYRSASSNRLAASPIVRSYSAVAMTVRLNRELQRRDSERAFEPSTRYIEIALPHGVSYNAGDHLGIVPRNGLETISAGADAVQTRPEPLCDDSPRACAFSRERGKPKTHVQQAVAANSDVVWDLLEKEAPVCVWRGLAHGARRQASIRRSFLQAHRRLRR